METLDQWFIRQTSTPAGSIVMMILVFLARVTIDQWSQRRHRKKAAKKKRSIVHG